MPHQSYRLWLISELNSTNQMRIPVVVEWLEVVPPHRMRLAFSAHFGNQEIQAEGAFGLVTRGEADTDLDFVLEFATLNPMLARMITNLAPRYIDNFFKCVKTELTRQDETAVHPTTERSPTQET